MLAAVALLFGIAVLRAAVEWLLAHWWVVLVAAAGAVAVAAVRARWRQSPAGRRGTAPETRFDLPLLDALHHGEFEEAVRDLMFRDGCADAVRTGGRGDLGADVVGTDPSGRRWVVQCKHRSAGASGSAIGTPDLQRLNGTARPVHGADVVVLVTNGRFTRDARTFGRSQEIHLVGRELLARWAGGTWPLWRLLPQLPGQRGQSAR